MCYDLGVAIGVVREEIANDLQLCFVVRFVPSLCNLRRSLKGNG